MVSPTAEIVTDVFGGGVAAVEVTELAGRVFALVAGAVGGVGTVTSAREPEPPLNARYENLPAIEHEQHHDPERDSAPPPHPAPVHRPPAAVHPPLPVHGSEHTAGVGACRMAATAAKGPQAARSDSKSTEAAGVGLPM